MNKIILKNLISIKKSIKKYKNLFLLLFILFFFKVFTYYVYADAKAFVYLTNSNVDPSEFFDRLLKYSGIVLSTNLVQLIYGIMLVFA